MNDLAASFGIKESFIGDYTLLNTIGKGSFAKVWLACHVLTGTEVAVKAINQCDITRYFEEAHCLKSLNHPNITKLFEVIATEEKLYLIMEHVSGGDLLDYLENHGPRSEREAQAMFRQLISAVQYCHGKGIIHRDLTPDNILIDGERNIKLADFGFGREFTNYKLTTYCGTIPYMAPEIMQHQIYNGPKVDAWSLGVVLYRMLVGDLPFVGDTFGEIKKKILHGKVRIPRQLSEEGQKLLKKLLILDPRRRPTLEDIMSDPWVNMGQKEELRPYSEPPGGDIDPQVTETMKSMGFREHEIQESLTQKKYNRVMGTYLILKTSKTQMKGHTIQVRPRPSPDPSSRNRTEEPAVPSSCLGSRTTTPQPGLASSSSSSSSQEERMMVPPPSLASRTSTSLPSPESGTATPSQALPHGPGGLPTTHSRGSSSSSRRASDGTTAEVCFQTAQPIGGTPVSTSGHRQDWQGVAQRAFKLFLKCPCCEPSTKQGHKRTKVKPE
ncbi:serine/threonine-protein kinase MARK2-like [Phyllostomus hastatus]|uniref:serine/threonine-protein kinase MARK2-like n=1 Tax=Phyllostomus hastatus TaxID=9423 RepID=UPI001E682CA0|nr:serine/threonine-protein kinase MARK2-like [Phyllostomus hastatus]